MLLALRSLLFATGGTSDPVTFDGPSISTVNLVVDVTMSPRDYSVLFSDSLSEPLTFTLTGTPPAGVTLSSAGVLSGTPTETGTFAGLVVTATNPTLDTADSNSFSIIVAATPTAPPTGTARGGYVTRALRGMVWGR
jgi:hypothetical protein